MSITILLKIVCENEQSRHRGPLNFLVHLMAGSSPTATSPKKPSLDLGLPAPPAAA